MVYSKPLNILVVLVLLSFAKGFLLLGDWRFVKLTEDTITQSINNWENSGEPAINSDDSTQINPFLSCNSISLNNAGFSLTADVTSIIATIEYAFGFWVNFESTISDKVFQFGIDSGPHYKVSSTVNGSLKVSYFSDATTTNSADDFSFTVPLSNSYTDKYFFIVFHFMDGLGITLEVMLPGIEKISNTRVNYSMPGGNFLFGKGIKGKFHQVVATKSATINSSFDTITLNDGSTTSDLALPCTPETCIDSVCQNDNMGSQWCVSSKDYCTNCDATGCTACDPDSARNSGGWCQNCDGAAYELKNYRCNFYLGCATANKCAECSTKSTKCDFCATGYFLNDDSATSTSCLSCIDSCTSCHPGPNCYACAEAITQIGTTCRADSIGFEVSFDGQNIVIDFAHALKTGLSKSSFTATSNSGSSIDASTWTITGCTAGLKQCIVNAPNVQESDLPITINFDFTQV